jgi:hypothetical protein
MEVYFIEVDSMGLNWAGSPWTSVQADNVSSSQNVPHFSANKVDPYHYAFFLPYYK